MYRIWPMNSNNQLQGTWTKQFSRNTNLEPSLLWLLPRLISSSVTKIFTFHCLNLLVLWYSSCPLGSRKGCHLLNRHNKAAGAMPCDLLTEVTNKSLLKEVCMSAQWNMGSQDFFLFFINWRFVSTFMISRCKDRYSSTKQPQTCLYNETLSLTWMTS